MSDGFDTLPPDVRAILRAERAHVRVPDDARARLAERLAVGVPGFGQPHVPATTVAPPNGPLATAVAKALVVLALGGGAATALNAALPHGHGSTPAHPQATAVIARELAPHTRARVLVEEPDVTRAPAPPSPTSPVVTAPRATAPLSTPLASLREERRLLDAARDAIVRGEPDGALAPTASHAARFPQGVLAEERDALRIRALVRLGRADEARALLATMRAEHPRSFLLEGAAADVEAIP